MGNISVDYDVLNQKGSPAWYSDLFANIPTPGYKGRMFISTDTFAFYRDNGVGWDLVGGPGTGTITGAGVFGQVTFFSGTDTISGNTDFVWDNTNKRLGINTGTPGAPLDIHTTGTAAQFNGTTTNNAFVLFQNAGTSKWRIGNLYNSGANDYQIFDVLNSTARLTIKNTGASTLIGTFTATSLIKSGGTSSQILLADGTTTPTSTFGAGSVTNVSAITLGTSGTDLSSSVANSTTTPVITLNVPTASATNRGALSSADWTTFNNKQATITLTTTGSSGAATLVGATLNIPNYTNVGTVTSVAALTLGTSGTDLSSSVANSTSTPVITLNVPTASATNRGALSSADFTTFNNKQATISVTAPVVLTGATISMPAATTSVNGYLTSTDWNTFNNKSNTNGTVTSVVALTIGTTGIDITSTAVTTTTTPVITLNIPTASASNRGALSSTDWTTFNNKQATLSLTTTGTSGAATLVANTLNIPNYGSALSGYLPLTGGTLTGPLFGTSATFSGNVIIGGSFPVYLKFNVQETSANRVAILYRGTQGADASMVTAFGTPYLSIGAQENLVNSIQTIGFGFTNGTSFIQPGEIGFQTTSISGYTLGDLVFATRGVTTNTAPTERLRIASTGAATFTNTETTLNYNPQTSLLSGYNYLNFGGGSIMYRNASDLYFGFNAKYGSAGTLVANYTTAQGMGMFTMNGGALNYQANDTSVTAGTSYAVPIRFSINGNGNVGIATTTPTGYGTTLQVSATNSADDSSFVLGSGLGTSTNRYLAAKPGSSGNFYLGTDNGNIYFATSLNPGTSIGTTRLTIASTGTATFVLDAIINSLTIGKGNNSLSNNTAIGVGTLASVTTGNFNTAVGESALNVNTTGNFNNAIGCGALSSNTTGVYNAASGSYALQSNTTGGNNTGIGAIAMTVNTTGSNNTAIGQAALNQNSTGQQNTAVGSVALTSVTGSNNIGVGYSAGSSITTGTYNSVFGSATGITTGSYNTMLGIVNTLGNTSNNIVLADGQGNIKYNWDGTNNNFYGSMVFNSAITQGGGIYIANSSFNATGGTTTTFYTFSSSAVQQYYLITLNQQGAGGNMVFGIASMYSANTFAANIYQDNTNPALYLTLSMSGLNLQLTVAAGYGNTTWRFAITKIL